MLMTGNNWRISRMYSLYFQLAYSIFWYPSIIHFHLVVILVSEVMVSGYRPLGVGCQRWRITVDFNSGEKLLEKERT